jgi:hypothetical protein
MEDGCALRWLLIQLHVGDVDRDAQTFAVREVIRLTRMYAATCGKHNAIEVPMIGGVLRGRYSLGNIDVVVKTAQQSLVVEIERLHRTVHREVEG